MLLPAAPTREAPALVQGASDLCVLVRRRAAACARVRDPASTRRARCVEDPLDADLELVSGWPAQRFPRPLLTKRR
jgi:hypothetical protein